MPKEVSRVMSMPYSRQALRMLRRELRCEPSIDEIHTRSKWLEHKAWIRKEVALCMTHVHWLEKGQQMRAQLDEWRREWESL